MALKLICEWGRMIFHCLSSLGANKFAPTQYESLPPPSLYGLYCRGEFIRPSRFAETLA